MRVQRIIHRPFNIHKIEIPAHKKSDRKCPGHRKPDKNSVAARLTARSNNTLFSKKVRYYIIRNRKDSSCENLDNTSLVLLYKTYVSKTSNQSVTSQQFADMSSILCLNVTGSISFAAKLQSTYIAVNVINGVCSFVAVVGNFLTILALLRNSSLRTPSFLLLCSLSVSDLGVGLICQPLYIALRVAETKIDRELSCKLSIAYSSFTGCFAALSFLTITAISFDRFLAVHLGIKYRGVVTVKKIKVAIFVLWLVAMMLGMTYALKTSIFLSIIIIGLCLTFAAFNYLAIARKLYAHSSQLQTHNSDVKDGKQRYSSNLGRYKKTLKSMLYVYGAFLMCYLPYLCCIIIMTSIGHSSTVYAVYLITVTILLANSAINPCLYYWRITELRKAYRRMLGFNCLVAREREATSTSLSVGRKL